MEISRAYVAQDHSVYVAKSDFTLNLQMTNLQPREPIHNASSRERKRQAWQLCEGAIRYWDPHCQPLGMMANTKIICRFSWAFSAAFCPNTSA